MSMLMSSCIEFICACIVAAFVRLSLRVHIAACHHMILLDPTLAYPPHPQLCRQASERSGLQVLP